jgi:hypothetical protein
MNINKTIICAFFLCGSPLLFGQNSLQEIEIIDNQPEEILSEDSVFINEPFMETISMNDDVSISLNMTDKSTIVPLSKVFYKLGPNILHSFTYNYGANYAVAALGTYGMVKSGIDWEWNRMSYNNKWVAYSGTPFGALGYLVPVAAPIGLYVYGRKHETANYRVGIGTVGVVGFGNFVLY